MFLPTIPPPSVGTIVRGMTYRQWLVGLAIQGLLASDIKGTGDISVMAKEAVKQADAVIAELEKQEMQQ